MAKVIKKFHFLGPSLSKLDHKLAGTNWLFCDILPTFLRLNRPFSILQYCFVLLVFFMFPIANWTLTNWNDRQFFLTNKIFLLSSKKRTDMELKAHFYKDLSIKKMGLYGNINGKDIFLFGNF